MRNWIRIPMLIGAGLACVGAVAGNDRIEGYLASDAFDVTHVIEPAPRVGDPRYETDREIFRATRAFAGSERWKMATQDADLGTRALLRAYSCTSGIALTPENAPKLVHVLERASVDTARETDEAKAFYRRGRPYTIDKGPICQARSELYDGKAHRVSYDYPSGHTTRGWTYALVLAALIPGRAQQIMERGRAYGDSRFVCGAHNESAVEAGFLSATATMTAIAAKPAYQADLAQAREEMAALRANAPAPAGCEREAELLKQRVMPNPGAMRRAAGKTRQ